MKLIKGLISILIIMGMIIGATPVRAEEEFSEMMSQVEFAKMLVKTIGAEGYLPPAAVENDYFVFLTELGIIPPEGWDPEGVIIDEDLIAILNLSLEEAKDLSFADLVDRLKERLARLVVTRGRFKHSVSPETE